MDAGSFISISSEKSTTSRCPRAPLRDVAPTMYMPPLRSTSSLLNPLHRQTNSDRFIPDRSTMDFDFAHFQLTESRKEKENLTLMGAFLANVMAGAAALRDVDGQFLGALSTCQMGGSPLEAEGIGLSLALNLCRRKNIKKVIIEGDCKVLIDVVTHINLEILWRVRHVIEESRAALKLNDGIPISYTSRNSNKVAHALAADSLLKKT